MKFKDDYYCGITTERQTMCKQRKWEQITKYLMAPADKIQKHYCNLGNRCRRWLIKERY